MSDKLNLFKEKVIDRYFEANDNESKVLEIVIEDSDIQKEVLVISEPTIISHGTEIQGNLKVQGALEVYGKVNGDIFVAGELLVNKANVVGQVHARNIMVKNSIIQGDVTAVEKLEVCDESKIIGCIHAKDVVLNSQCQGDIYADDSLHLMSFSNVVGAVCVKRLTIDEGAIIDGQIKMEN